MKQNTKQADEVVDLGRPDLLPKEFQRRLAELEPLLKTYSFHSQLRRDPTIMAVADELTEYWAGRRVVGVHYTRADPQSISERGLLVRSGEEIRQAFLKEHGHRFTAEELETMGRTWEHTRKEKKTRDHKLWFSFLERQPTDPFVIWLLGLYGGEQVTMGLHKHPTIAEKLSSIGKPLIVRCSLNPSKLWLSDPRMPLGFILISSYHAAVNPAVDEPYDVDTCQTEPVPPDEILEIREVDLPPFSTWLC